ncbi:MAG: ammonium transporter [Bacteriovoracaceae bacterium]|jgi:ammonium transporter, Amt family|nr:ammonium transporter [Bacteriovoracaceae bacterium]
MGVALIKLLILTIPQSLADPLSLETLQTNLNTVWTLLAACLVFFMQAGFAMVEIGLTRAKNAINIIMKNLMDFSIGSLCFFMVGAAFMFGKSEGFLGTTGFFLSGTTGNDWNYTFALFQTVFAGTAATIVSGAMAERTKFTSYLVYGVVITAFIYPVFGGWAWGSLGSGGGWLESLSSGAFLDFAGSTVVHSVGGWLALAGALVIGPRKGKFDPNGNPRAIPGHNIPFAALGVFILWFGWFGFNAGSTTVGDGSIGRIAMITNLSGAAGAITSMITAWILFKKPDASMSLNGALAGLVGITAGCANLTAMAAIFVGSIAGVLVVLSILFIEKKLKVDDPVGAISVHGVCGVWGTLAVGLFHADKTLGIGQVNLGLFYGGGFSQTLSQLIGIGSAFIWAFGTGYLLFALIKKVFGLRATADEEYRGLDIEEHGLEAYYTSK